MSGIPDDFPVELLDAFSSDDVPWPYCDANSDLYYLCTRPKGHTGDHVATTGEDPAECFCQRWPQ
jgi:hypothetical protein